MDALLVSGLNPVVDTEDMEKRALRTKATTRGLQLLQKKF
jgi:hypothetical protein